MSWFSHKPRPKDSPRANPPKRTGPITRDLWNQTKEKAKPVQDNPVDKK